MTADAILSALDFYRLAAPHRRAEYAGMTTAVSLSEGTMFYHEGDACQQVGIVGRGDIRVFRTAPGGREITLYHVRDHEPCLVNMLSVFLSRPAGASAVVEARTDAVLVPASVVRKWLTRDESVRTFIFETMAARLTEVMTLAVEISVSRMDVRLASLLLRLVDVHGVNGTIHRTHDELAAELGTAREVVSRLLKELERAGALHLARSQITVLDAAILAHHAASGRAPIND